MEKLRRSPLITCLHHHLLERLQLTRSPQNTVYFDRDCDVLDKRDRLQ
ncbi:hypothetical protein [Oculatella sp. LEGE 06141]|nr:hypothetical protein [Oculatella sp. LEGE 06141]